MHNPRKPIIVLTVDATGLARMSANLPAKCPMLAAIMLAHSTAAIAKLSAKFLATLPDELAADFNESLQVAMNRCVENGPEPEIACFSQWSLFC